MKVVDVVIIGGGLSGAALLLALKNSGLKILMVDSQDFFTPRKNNTTDTRSLTLSVASLRILKNLEVWEDLAPFVTDIKAIHVSEQGRFGTAYIEAPQQAAMGYVVPIQRLVTALYQRIERHQVLAPAVVTAFDSEQNQITVSQKEKSYFIQASLIVAADGSQSSMREFCDLPVQVKDYGQQALVTQIQLARAHQHIAYERFTNSGPLALLPLEPKKMGVVWSLNPADAAQMQIMEEQDFLNTLLNAFGYRVGRFVSVEQRLIYPLKQMLMPQAVHNAVVFIGNAAHTLHPIAGQGFNLGLRDVAMLAQMIQQCGIQDASLLTRYQQARQHDQHSIARLTDGLVSLYGQRHFAMRMARQMGLIAFDNNRILKNMVARYASGLGGVVPDLVCGIPL